MEKSLNEMIANPDKFLAEDGNLDNLILRYVFKRMFEDDSENVMKIFSEVWKKDFEEGSSKTQQSVAAKIQRVQALKVYETDKYIFLLPTDVWDEGKIKLSEFSAAEYIAPQDLTAISKVSCREVRFFAFDDLLEVNEELLKPNGYEIPASWVDIFPEVASRRELMDKYKLEFTKESYNAVLGCNEKSFGEYWTTSTVCSKDGICMLISLHCGGVNPELVEERSCNLSARCVSYRR